ncbi:MAG TPA: MarR family transcriptional regulator [Clostridia bacterium]|nr:MarR family transcriptional regulator [Clostridia bacterium]
MNEIDNEVYIVGELFRELYRKISLIENKKHLYKEFTELTLIEIDTILVIGCEEKKSMSEIAKMLGVSFGTPTVTIDRLINKGFVERTRDDADRRQVFIELSPKGKEVYNSVVELKNKATRIIFGILTKEEREGTIEVLSKLNNNFNEMIIKI